MASSSSSAGGPSKQLHDKLPEIISNRRYEYLTSLTHEWELRGTCTDDEAEDMYSLQMVSLLLQNQISNARFLWKRLPAGLKKKSKQLKALWQIGCALWERKPEEFYLRATAHNWSKRVRPLVGQLQDVVRARTEELIGRAFSSIALQKCCAMLGLSPDQAKSHIGKLGWREENNIVYPVAKQTSKSQKTSLAQLDQLTQYAMFLEK